MQYPLHNITLIYHHTAITKRANQANSKQRIMSSPQNKKQRRQDTDQKMNTDDSTFSSLSIDILSNILGHLPLEDIMRSRRICKKTIEAAKETQVPLGKSSPYRDYFTIDSVEKYNALIVMAEELPGLNQIRLSGQSYDSRYKKKEGEFKYIDGEDPDENVAAGSAEYITLDIVDALSKFPQLRGLDISRTPLNGR